MTNRNYRRSRKYRKLGIKFISLGIVLCALVFLTEKKIDPLIFSICDYNCAILANKIVSDGIDYEIKQTDKYKDFVDITTDSGGNITSIQTNTIDANQFVIDVGNNIDKFISKTGNLSYVIRSGSLTGLSILYDRGFPITVKVTPTGYVETTLVSTFSTAGINQTVHETVLEIELSMASQLPIGQKITMSTAEVLIAQTVIVGKVPEMYREYCGESQAIAKSTTRTGA